MSTQPFANKINQRVFQFSDPVVQFKLTERGGDPKPLEGLELRLIACASGDDVVFIAEDSDFITKVKGLAEVQLSRLFHTLRAGSFSYRLWDDTNNLVLSEGLFEIIKNVSVDTPESSSSSSV